jgi:predicted nucleic acid-binding protein
VTLYLDTSALVKLYAREEGSTEVKRAVARAGSVATSLLAYVETRSAFARKRRFADIDDTALRHYKQEFEQDWISFNRLPVDATTIRRAGDLVERYRLKAYDAVHLATAELFQEAVRSAIDFVSFDDALNGAAAGQGFKLMADG